MPSSVFGASKFRPSSEHATYAASQWRNRSSATPESAGSAEACGARRDLAWLCRRSIHTADLTGSRTPLPACAGMSGGAISSPPSDGNLQREIVNHFVTLVGHDEGVAEEDAEQAVRRDRVGLGHDDHAGLEDFLKRLGGDVLGDHVRLVGDEIDAVHLRRTRLVAVVAEEAARLPHILDRLAGRDLGDDLLVARQRDLLPEIAHHVIWLAHANGRADLGGVAAIAGGKLHND